MGCSRCAASQPSLSHCPDLPSEQELKLEWKISVGYSKPNHNLFFLFSYSSQSLFGGSNLYFLSAWGKPVSMMKKQHHSAGPAEETVFGLGPSQHCFILLKSNPVSVSSGAVPKLCGDSVVCTHLNLGHFSIARVMVGLDELRVASNLNDLVIPELWFLKRMSSQL